MAGDFTGDARADLAVYRQDTTEIGVYAVLQTAPGALTQARTVPVAFHNSQQPVNPVLVPLNTDVDSPVLRYDEGRYQLVFSEPIVIAALAAAPFKNGIGQNVGACRTTFGNTESTSSESERTVSVTASSTVGYGAGIDLELTQAALELRSTARVAASRLASHAYTLSKTILFTSGPAEDLVVFTTVPLDQYTYTVLSHPDPELVGKPLVVSLPRDPITLQAERGFFNRSLPERFLGVDESIFAHAIGDPRSYPTRAEKQALLLANDGLEVGPVSVGQGSGETELTLEVGEELGAAQSRELRVEGGEGVRKGGVGGKRL